MLRRIAGVIAGLAIAISFVLISEVIPHKLHPPPPGFNERDMNQIKAFVATMPSSMLFVVLTGHLIGTLAGTAAAAGIAKNRIPGYILGVMLLAGGIWNSIVIPQPVWF